MRDSTFMAMAQVVAKESKCISTSVGSILRKDDRIISSGINGTPRGSMNCDEAFAAGHFKRGDHHSWSLKHEIHSELNLLLNCSEEKKGTILYVTHSPCFNCTKHIIAAGVKSIYFREKYDKVSASEFKEIRDFCYRNGVGLIEMAPNGTWVYHSLGAREVSHLFEYISGGLYWKERPREEILQRVWASWSSKNVGHRFGADHSSHKAVYRRGRISGCGYLEHTLVWILLTGKPPKKMLDHINGVGTDNREENLREVTNSENLKNMPLRVDNKSGRVGVRQLPSGKWAVYIKSQYQGCREDFSAAVSFREELEVKHGFHENHGRG